MRLDGLIITLMDGYLRFKPAETHLSVHQRRILNQDDAAGAMITPENAHNKLPAHPS